MFTLLKKLKFASFFALLSTLSCTLYANKMDQDQIEVIERIKPVGSVCIKGVECPARKGNISNILQASASPRSGEQIYTKYCTTCHATGLLNAPKKGDTGIWKTKLNAAGSYEKLLEHAINGINAMPPKGTCMDCSEEEISLAIQFMSELAP